MSRNSLRPARRAYSHRAVAAVSGEFVNESSMVFNGANSIYTSGSWPELSSSNLGYSVAFWAKVDVTSVAYNDHLFTLSDSAGKYRLSFFKQGGIAGYYRVYEGNSDTVSFSSSYGSSYGFIIDDLWHHYAITSPGDGGTVITYLDGVRFQSFTGKNLGSNLASTKLFVASTYYVTGGSPPCNIDEFAIFGTELSASAVSDLYNDGIPTDLSDHASIQHWWRMGDGTGDTASDIKDQEGSWDLDTANNTPALSTDVPYVGIDSVVPYYGVAAGGTTITISGSGFNGVTDVKIGAGSVSSFTVVDVNTITIVTDAVAAGTYDLEVITSNGSLTRDDGFVYVASIPAWASTSSMVFDGTNSLYTTTPWPELSSSNLGYSVAFWAKVDTASMVSSDYLFILSDSAGKRRLRLFKHGNRWRAYEGNSDTVSFEENRVDLYNFIVDDAWHHYTITSPGDGGTVIIYLDGVRAGDFTGKNLGSNLASTRLFVASVYYVTSGLTPCNIDEFAIFSSELSYSAVTAIYNDGAPTDLSGHANIQHYWRLGDGIGDTASLVRDQVGGWDLNLPHNSPALDVDAPYIIVDSVDPYYDDVAGVTVITITGSNLANVTGVTIGVDACTSVSATASSVTATTPAVSAGVYDLVVSDPYGFGTLVDGFVYRTGAVPAWSNTYSTFFDGVDDSIFTTTNWPELSSSDAGYSVAFWVKVDSASIGSGSHIFTLSNPFYKYRLRMIKQGSTAGHYRIYEGNADTVSFSSTRIDAYSILTDDAWHHLVITSEGDDGAFMLYVDGALAFTQSTGTNLGTNLAATKLFLASSATGSYAVLCDIDEFAMFGITLSAGQVSTMYNSGTPTDITSHTGIQHYWRMGDAIGDLGTIVRDQVGGWNLDLALGAPTIQADVPEEWTPESIAGLLIWVDPSDASTVAESGGDVVTIADKSASGLALATPLAFTADADIQAAVIGTEGNGLNFLKVGSATPLKLEYTPVGAPYNTNTVGGPSEEWLLWGVWTLGVYTASGGATGLHRGRAYYDRAQYAVQYYLDAATGYKGPSVMQKITASYAGTTAFGYWRDDSLPTPPADWTQKTFAVFSRSFNDGGTMKIEISQNAVDWYVWDHGVTTTATISGGENKWGLSMRYADTSKWSWSGVGEQGFHNGAKSRADALQIYNYLDAKWGLDI